MTTDIGTINTPRLMAGNESNSMAVNIEAVCATSFHLSSFHSYRLSRYSTLSFYQRWGS